MLWGLFSINSCSEQGLLSSCGAWLLIVVVSLIAEQGLHGTWALVVAAHGLNSGSSRALGHRFNSFGLSCSVAHGILLDQGSPVSPTLSGGFFITDPPGKPGIIYF